MIGPYHRDLRRRIERLEEHYQPAAEPEAYQCWKNLAGEIVILNGPRLCWVAKDHPGETPPPIPAPWYLPPPLTINLRTDEPSP